VEHDEAVVVDVVDTQVEAEVVEDLCETRQAGHSNLLLLKVVEGVGAVGQDVAAAGPMALAVDLQLL